ncbi:DNA cytosine methyltransferase [Allosphingosinicella sp.]|jgi:DNA (cytosine-5)-methyltransferase 1|uniref:DNA cytosine methyltransferase n=1 Tax=Allosphingosinicella sp. TaxID=2823234 RepID=UPI003D71078B
MKCLSLFAGAGGLDQGLQSAGFSIAASVEVDRDCCETLSRNFEHRVIQKRVDALSDGDLASFGQIDFVVGGPPCQPFSKSALWTTKAARGFEDARATSIDDFFSCVEALKPEGFLIENVPGFKGFGGLDRIVAKLDELRTRGISYDLSWKIIDAAAFGVPQHRKRFFAIGVRSGAELYKFPLPTHGQGFEPYRTTWDALGGLTSFKFENEPELTPRGRWSDLLPSIPPGQNYLWHTARGGGLPLFGWRTRYWSFLQKIDPGLPAPTIVASPSQNSGPFHWENRLLSTTELASLQSFPPTFKFSGDRASRHRQIGNAVPPILAEALGRSLLDAFGREPEDRRWVRLGRQGCTPVLPNVAPVPKQYLKLAGNHLDHPGPGKGPRPRGLTSRELESAV